MATQNRTREPGSHHFHQDFSTIYIHVTTSEGGSRTLRIRPSQFGIHIESGDVTAPLTLTTTGINQLIIEP